MSKLETYDPLPQSEPEYYNGGEGMSKKTIAFIILGFTLTIVLTIVGMNLYSNYNIISNEEINNISMQAFNLGVLNLQQQIVNEASTCKPIPMFVGNETVNGTINLIAYECLNLNQGG